jgi:hypothetical protein
MGWPLRLGQPVAVEKRIAGNVTRLTVRAGVNRSERRELGHYRQGVGKNQKCW